MLSHGRIPTYHIEFGGSVVGGETAKVKSASIISYATRNDVMQ